MTERGPLSAEGDANAYAAAISSFPYLDGVDEWSDAPASGESCSVWLEWWDVVR